jgi:hypothetical protein
LSKDNTSALSGIRLRTNCLARHAGAGGIAQAAPTYCGFFTSGHLESGNGWNAWSAGIVATSL